MDKRTLFDYVVMGRPECQETFRAWKRRKWRSIADGYGEWSQDRYHEGVVAYGIDESLDGKFIRVQFRRGIPRPVLVVARPRSGVDLNECLPFILKLMESKTGYNWPDRFDKLEWDKQRIRRESLRPAKVVGHGELAMDSLDPVLDKRRMKREQRKKRKLLEQEFERVSSILDDLLDACSAGAGRHGEFETAPALELIGVAPESVLHAIRRRGLELDRIQGYLEAVVSHLAAQRGYNSMSRAHYSNRAGSIRKLVASLSDLAQTGG